MTTGDRIRQLRLEKGWTQEDLAARCGYSGKSVISKTESAGNDIGTRKLKKIAVALGVSPTSLVEWDSKEDYNGDDDKKALHDFVMSADPDTIHQLRLYADFLKSQGEVV